MELDRKAHIHAMDDDDQWLLNLAIQNGNLEEALLLIKKGPLVGENFHLFLVEAIERNNHTILKMLIDHGIQYNPSIDLKIHLKAAISQKNAMMIGIILPHCVFSKPSDQYILKEFVIATDSQHKNCVELLLKWNFTINPKDCHNENIIFAAIENGYLKIVLKLLNFKINVNMINSKTGLNLLAIACLNKHHKIIEKLLQYGAHRNSRISSKNSILNNHECFGPNLRLFEKLFPINKCKIHSIDVTCLHIAIFNSDWMTTDILLRHGATIKDCEELFNLTCIAARNGCDEIVDILLNHGVKVININSNGKSLLRLCVKFNSLKKDYGYNVAKLLLKKGADKYLKTPKNTFVFEAINNIHCNTAQLFLDHNADVQYISPQGDTLLHKAIEKDFDVEFIKTLLKLNSPVNSEHANGLLIACKTKSKNQLKIIKVLLDHNADVKCKDNDLKTPLHYACEKLNLELVTILLEKGANPNVKDRRGNTPLYSACNHRKNTTPAIIELLLQYGTNIEATDINNNTPLLRICMKEDYNAVKCLLNHNANPRVVDYQGRTPLHYFCSYRGDSTLEIIKLLLERGVDINAVDIEGWTPLFVACQVGDDAIVECLLDNHANPHHIDLKNLTPLHIAIKNYQWYPRVIDILLNYNVNINCVDNNGKSIIHYIAEKKDERLVKKFALFNVDLNSVDNQGNTPLHVAVKKISDEITKSLIKYGANINILNKNNKTPLEEAIDMPCPVVSEICYGIYFKQWKKRIIMMIKTQVVKLKVAELEVHNQNLDIIYDSVNGKLRLKENLDDEDIRCDVQQLELECEQEIEMMKRQSIGIDLTFCDLLKENINFLSQCIGIQTVQQTLDLEVCDKKFPLYIDIIRNRFREVLVRYKRKKLINSAREYLRVIITQRLPDECIEMILDYFNNEELNMFVGTIEPFNSQSVQSREHHKATIDFDEKYRNKFFLNIYNFMKSFLHL